MNTFFFPPEYPHPNLFKKIIGIDDMDFSEYPIMLFETIDAIVY